MQTQPQSAGESEMELSSTAISVQQTQFLPQGLQHRPLKPTTRRPYGNLIVFCTRPVLLTLGPDYLCFMMGFLFFCALSFLLCFTVFKSFDNRIIFFISCTISLIQCLSYLTVAFSTPSIALAANNPIKEVNQLNKHMICKRCGGYAQRSTHHCRLCDVCVEQYDHHCPWTSRCIGKGNIYPFYVFGTVTPIYFLCFMGLMMACLVASASNAAHHKNLKTHL